MDYFYPRSPCGERLTLIQKIAHLCLISIHALLAESDVAWNRFTQRRDFISIHALLAESDRGAVICYLDNIDFYPRSPCGERHARRALGFVDPDISIHALLAESDSKSAQNSGALLRI